MAMTMNEAVVRRISVCYPSDSLSCQMAQWAGEHEECTVEPVFARSTLELRRLLQGADMVLIDATEDHAQAIDAFSQSIARLGSSRVTVYSERMHEGLELFVRKQGSWLLLGPLDRVEWEGLFSRTLGLTEEIQAPVVMRRAA